jgi:hypothetical protein
MLSAIDRSPLQLDKVGGKQSKINETFRGSGEESKESNDASIHLWGYSPDFAAGKVSAVVKPTVSQFTIGTIGTVDKAMDQPKHTELSAKV